MTHSNKERGWLHGVRKRPGTVHTIPVDRVLKMWGEGLTISQIQSLVKRPSGQQFSVGGLYGVVLNAREEGNELAGIRRHARAA